MVRQSVRLMIEGIAEPLYTEVELQLDSLDLARMPTVLVGVFSPTPNSPTGDKVHASLQDALLGSQQTVTLLLFDRVAYIVRSLSPNLQFKAAYSEVVPFGIMD